MSNTLRVVIADDERPARSFLRAALGLFDDVTLVGEAESGFEALELIESTKPDLALLDFAMPELNGLQVARALKRHIPIVAFVTAFDEHAVEAFELQALDYLLKPVDTARLRQTVNRAIELAEHRDLNDERRRVRDACAGHAQRIRALPLERIPVRRRDEVALVPVAQLVSVVAEGELLHLTTYRNERYTITYRLKDLEVRISESEFVRLGRGAIVRIDAISKISALAGGTYEALLVTGDRMQVSRIQSRLLKERLLRL